MPTINDSSTNEGAAQASWHSGDWMQTLSGRVFYPLAPRAEDVDIVDVAHSLSMQCRYNGHVKQFYSVAEHCVLMTDWLLNELQGSRPRDEVRNLALWALLHDAPEAYVGDMVRPLKLQMPTFRDADDRVMSAIADRFGLAGGTRYELGDGTVGLTLPAEVKAVDMRILLDERAVLLNQPARPWNDDGLRPLGVKIRGLSPSDAKLAYLDRFYALTN